MPKPKTSTGQKNLIAKNLIELSKTKLNAKGYHPAVINDVEKCIACASCARTCPDVVIHIEKD